MVPTKTEEQTADILTKSLKKAKFKKFREALGMVYMTTLKTNLPWGVLKEGKATFYNALHYARVKYLPWSSLDLVINKLENIVIFRNSLEGGTHVTTL